MDAPLLNRRLDLSPEARRALAAAGIAFLLSRALVYGAALVAPFFLPERIYSDLPNVAFHTSAPWAMDALVRWDAIHYLSIAREGYHMGQSPWDTNTPFLPLYPWLLGLLGGWAGDLGRVYAGLLLSNCAFFAALVLLYRLVEEDFGLRIAQRSVLYLAVFPTAFYFSALYAESLFLLFVLAFFTALRKERWLLAAVFGGLAALTRIPGVLLLAVYLWEWLRARWTARSPSAPSLAAGALIPGGSLVFLFTLWLQVGDPLAFAHTAGFWGRTFVPPLTQIGMVLDLLLPQGGRVPGPGLLVPAAATLLFGSAGVWCWKHGLGTYGGWLLLTLGFYLAFPATSPLVSMLRYLLPLFPAYIAFAHWGERRWFHFGYLSVATGLLLLSTVLFVQWYWVA